MILFKACPRCDGDIEATYPEDVYCVQCGCRPPGASPKADVGSLRSVDGAAGHEGHPLRSACPNCDGEEAVRLDRVRTGYNTCYRCRRCGHIFSPSAGESHGQPDAAVP